MKNRGPILLLLLVWAMSVALTWGIVENPFYDFPAYLNVAERVANGQALYLDYQWIYPPMSVWINGLIMRLFHGSYAAINTFATLLALGLLLAEYRLARLILSRPLSLLCALAAYGGLFTISSACGENFITSNTVYAGATLFAWFVWCAAKGFVLKSGTRYVLLAGLCGGLSLLVKHEFMAGVGAVGLFLLARTAALKFKSWGKLLLCGVVLLGIAFTSFAEAARHCGWDNLWAGLTAYGTLKEHAQRSWPSVVQVWQHLLLLGGYVALFLSLGHFTIASSATLTQERLQGFRKVWMLWVVVLAGVVLEIGRAWFALKQYGGETGSEVPQTVALAGLYAKQVPDVASICFYYGSIVCCNLIPIAMLLAIIGALLVVMMHRQGIRRSLQSRRALLWLLFVAGCGLQVRRQLSLSFPGVLDVGLPLVIFFVPVFWRRFHSLNWSPAFLKALRQRCAFALLVIGAILSALLYAFEFRASRFDPLTLETDKGLIRLPKTEEDHAFKAMVDYVRSHQLKNILAVPYLGIQYWTGEAAFPAWLGLIHPAYYPAPWRTYLDRELAHHPITFIVFDKLDVNYLSFPSRRSDGWDGPWYKPYRWKQAYPELWHAIQTHGELQGKFGPTNGSYFSIYTYRPPASRPLGSNTPVPAVDK